MASERRRHNRTFTGTTQKFYTQPTQEDRDFLLFFFYKSWEIINSFPFVKFFVPSQFSRVYMNSIFKGKYDKLMLMLIHKPIIYPCNFVFPCWFSLGSWTVHGAGTTVFRICVFKFGYARVCSYFWIKKETITLTFGLLQFRMLFLTRVLH